MSNMYFMHECFIHPFVYFSPHRAILLILLFKKLERSLYWSDRLSKSLNDLRVDIDMGDGIW